MPSADGCTGEGREPPSAGADAARQQQQDRGLHDVSISRSARRRGGQHGPRGVDFRAKGVSVRVGEAGTVVVRSFGMANGRSTLFIENNGRSRKTGYLQMSRMDVAQGSYLFAGQRAGTAGSVGADQRSASGPKTASATAGSAAASVANGDADNPQDDPVCVPAPSNDPEPWKWNSRILDSCPPDVPRPAWAGAFGDARQLYQLDLWQDLKGIFGDFRKPVLEADSRPHVYMTCSSILPLEQLTSGCASRSRTPGFLARCIMTRSSVLFDSVTLRKWCGGEGFRTPARPMPAMGSGRPARNSTVR